MVSEREPRPLGKAVPAVPARRSFRTNLGTTVTTNVLRGLLGFVTSVVITRDLTTQARGTFSFVTSGATVLLMLAGVGMGSALTRAKATGRADSTQLFRAAFVIGATMGASASLLFGVAYAVARRSLFSGITVGEAAAVAVLVPPLLILSHWTVVAYLDDRILEFSAAAIAGSLLFLFLVVGWAVADTLTAPVVVAAWAVTSLVPFGLLFRPRRVRGATQLGQLVRELVRYGLRANIAVVALVLAWRVDIFFVKGFRGVSELAMYAVAVGLAEIVLQVAVSLRIALTPMQGDRSDPPTLIAAIATVTRLTVAAGLAGAAIVLTFAHPIVVTLFGVRYGPSADALRWLIPGIVALVAQGPLIDFLLAEGRVRPVTAVALSALALNVGLNVALLPRHSFVAAAAASTATYALSCLLILLLFSRSTGTSWRALLVASPADLRAVTRRQS